MSNYFSLYPNKLSFFHQNNSLAFKDRKEEGGKTHWLIMKNEIFCEKRFVAFGGLEVACRNILYFYDHVQSRKLRLKIIEIVAYMELYISMLKNRLSNQEFFLAPNLKFKFFGFFDFKASSKNSTSKTNKAGSTCH